MGGKNRGQRADAILAQRTRKDGAPIAVQGDADRAEEESRGLLLSLLLILSHGGLRAFVVAADQAEFL